jgi:hypothetical protein
MNHRSFAAGDIVQLPKLNVAGAIALGTELATKAKDAGKLPAPIAKALGKLDAAHAALRTAAKDRLPDPATLDSPDAREADRVIDAAWSATFDWVSGWTRLPLDTNADRVAIARALMTSLFPEGLKFTQLQYKLEWAESQTRLDRIDAEHLGEKFTHLGGEDFLKTLRKAHKAYGDVLGLTKAKKAEAPVASLRDPLDAFLMALRSYVVKVTANADEDHPESVKFVDELLQPLASWQSAAAQPQAAASAPAESPAAPAAPGEKIAAPPKG